MNELLKHAELLQNTLIARATGRIADENDYTKTRKELSGVPSLKKYLPSYLETCRTLEQFWPFISKKFGTYAERRQFIWDSFNKLFQFFEKENNSPSDMVVSTTMSENAVEYINEQWKKALERRETDPEGAITTARTLIETTCKYILDNYKIAYDESIELPKLYTLTAKQLNLAPQNHQEEIFKQILGSCQNVVNGLGTLRNKVGDAHGKGINYIKPKERHAKLAVNLSGTLCSFLIDTYNANRL